MKKLLSIVWMLILLTACGPAAQPGLKDTAWNLVEIGGQSILPETVPTLTFDDQNAGGNGSCNGFGAEYQAQDGKLTFGPPMSTMMYCAPDEVMQQEQAYLAALEQTTAYQLADGRLTLLDSAGTVLLTFEKQATP